MMLDAILNDNLSEQNANKIINNLRGVIGSSRAVKIIFFQEDVNGYLSKGTLQSLLANISIGLTNIDAIPVRSLSDAANVIDRGDLVFAGNTNVFPAHISELAQKARSVVVFDHHSKSEDITGELKSSGIENIVYHSPTELTDDRFPAEEVLSNFPTGFFIGYLAKASGKLTEQLRLSMGLSLVGEKCESSWPEFLKTIGYDLQTLRTISESIDIVLSAGTENISFIDDFFNSVGSGGQGNFAASLALNLESQFKGTVKKIEDTIDSIIKESRKGKNRYKLKNDEYTNSKSMIVYDASDKTGGYKILKPVANKLQGMGQTLLMLERVGERVKISSRGQDGADLKRLLLTLYNDIQIGAKHFSQSDMVLPGGHDRSAGGVFYVPGLSYEENKVLFLSKLAHYLGIKKLKM